MPTRHRPSPSRRALSRLMTALVGSAVMLGAVAGPGMAADEVPNRLPAAQTERAATTVGQSVVIDVLANDTDPDGDQLTVTSVGTSYLTATPVTIGVDGRLTYTAGSRPGWDNFSYTISDGRGGQSTAYISVVVAALDTEANDPPIASGDYAETLEGESVTVAVLANDLDVDGPALTVSSVTQPPTGSGSVTLNGNQTVTYTPPAGALPYSSTSFSYTITDGTTPATANVSISVRNVNGPDNDAPFAANDNAVTVRSQPVTVAVLANDMDVDGDTLSLTGASMGYPGSGSGNGTVSADLEAGTVTYTPPVTPPAYSYSSDSANLTYTIADGNGGTATGQVYISILAEDPAVDDAPRLASDSAVTVKDTAVTIDVLANDTDIDTPTSTLIVTVSSSYPSPSSPTIVVNPDKTITYTPARGSTGNQSFSYSVSDGPNSVTSSVSVDVLAIDGPGNDAPIGQADNATVLQDRPATLAVLSNDYDFDGDTLRVSGLRSSTYSSGPDAATITTYSGGTVSVASGGDAIVYTPRAGYTGYESFAYTVSDPSGGSATVNVSVTVAPVETGNKRPILASDATHVAQGKSVVIHPLTNDFDPDGDALSITSASQPWQGTVTVAGDGQSLTYQAPATFAGSTSLSFSVSDKNGHIETGYVDVYVHMADNPDADDPPRAGSDNSITSPGTPVTIDVLANDFDIDTPRSGLSVTVTSPLYNGTAVVNDDKTITFTPDAGASNSSFSFSYQLSDGPNSVSGYVSGQLVPVDADGNAAPTLRNDYLYVRADGTTTLGVLANDYDLDTGDTLRITGLSSSPTDAPVTTLTFSDGSKAAVTGDGSAILFTSAPGASPYHSFSYTVSDGSDSTASTSVSVSTAATPTTNQAPSTGSDAVAVRRGGSVTVQPLANDFDADGDRLEIDSATTWSGATVTVSEDRQSLTISPPASTGPSPSSSFSVNYGARDGHGHVSSGYIEATIVLVDDPDTNEPPITASDSAVSTGGPVTIDVLANDFDIDTLRSDLTVSLSGGGYSNVVRNPDQTFTFTPMSGSSSSSSFSYTVNDGTNAVNGYANVEVLAMDTPGNDTPVVRSDNLAMLSGTTRDLPVLANDYDFDAGDKLVVTGLQRSSYEPVASRITTYNGGSAEITEDGTAIRFTPGTGSPGTGSPGTGSSGYDGFSYTVSDGTASATTSVSVTLIATGNRAPVTGSDSVMVGEGNTVVIEPLVNDFDADGDPLRIVSASVYLGTVSVSDDGQRLTYRAASATGSSSGYTGSPSINYSVSDGQGHTTSGYVSVYVHPVNHPGNDAPQARSDSAGVYAGASVTIPVLANDFDIDGDPLTVTRADRNPTSGYPNTGTISVAPDGRSVIFTATVPSAGPPPSSVYFQYEVSDGNGGTGTAQVSVTIYQRNTTGNEPPSANYDSAMTSAGVPVTIAVLANDTDIDGDTLTVTSAGPQSTNEAVAVEISPDGRSVIYTPPADPAVSGQSFRYAISDGNGGTASSYGYVTILAADRDGNDAPLARTDSAGTYQGRSVRIPVLVNDFDADGDTLAIQSVVSQPQHGKVAVDGDELVYTPNSAFAGHETFRYRVTDGALTSEATVAVHVEFFNQPGNDAPIAANYNASTVEDKAVTVDVLPYAVDYEHDPISLERVGVPGHGTAEIVAGRIRYTPTPGFVGSDRFSYVVSDGFLDSEPATIEVYVNADPAAQQIPVASGSELTIDEDTPVTGTFSASDGADADPITFVLVDGPSHGQVQVGEGGAFTYTPAPEYSGTDTLSFIARDADGDSAPATVSITIRAVNDAPLATPASVSVAEDGSVNVPLTGNDVDDDTLTYRIVAAPTHGTLSGTGDTRTYTPHANYHGADSFTFVADDGTGDSAPATIEVAVDGVDDAPVAIGSSVTLAEDTTTTVSLTGTDPDGDQLTYRIVTAPAHGTLSGSGDSRTYTPHANYHGSDSFTFVANDGTTDSAAATVELTVTPVNDGLTAGNDGAMASSGEAIDVAVLTNDSDIDGETLTVTVVSDPAHGTASIVAGGNAVQYRSDAGFTGTDPFTYTVSDGRGGTATATVTIQVARQAVEVEAEPGEPVVSAPAATTEIPVTIAVTSPTGGLVSIVENAASGSQSGYTLVGSQITIEAPPASAADPLRLVFRIDRGVLEAAGGSVNTVTVFRNGVAAGNCIGSATANPDPCVTSRVYDAATDDVVVTVLAAHASDWALGVALPVPVAPVTPTTPVSPVTPAPSTPARIGYWMLGSDGKVYNFGDATKPGEPAVSLAEPAVDIEPTPEGDGYWIIDARGRIYAYNAKGFANVDPSVLKPGEQVTSLSATRNGDGLWIFTNKGRVIVRGTAKHFGDVSHVNLNGPVLDSIIAPNGEGYYMVASDGGVFAFGSAVFHGSMGGHKLNAPVQSLVPDPDGTGYWLVASDGGVFAFNADFRGSMGGHRLNKPMTGMVPYGKGYLMVAEDGGIFDFSEDRDFLGSLGNRPPANPIVSVAVLDRPAR